MKRCGMESKAAERRECGAGMKARAVARGMNEAHLVNITVDQKYLSHRVEEDEHEEEVGARDQILGVENQVRLHVASATC